MTRDFLPGALIAGRTDSDIAAINAELLREAVTFNLLFECHDCDHWNPDAVECSMGYPFSQLLAVRGGPAPTGIVLEITGQSYFCKHFEAL